MSLAVIILAAGKGTRFKSNIPKVLHKLVEKPMIEFVIDISKELTQEKNIYVVIGYKKELIEQELKKYKDLNYVYQENQNGTGHAVMCCENTLNGFNGDILILCGDMPLIKLNTLREFYNFYKNNSLDIAVLTTELDNPFGYGRIIRNGSKVLKIIEEKDANEEIKKINEINTGIYLVKANILFNLLKNISNNNVQKEYYLTDIIEIANKNKLKVDGFIVKDSIQFLGINTKIQLAEAENILIKRKIEELMLDGVTFIKPETTFISHDVVIGRDTIIYPGNFITGKTKIGENCLVGQNNFIKDTEIDDDVVIKGFCYIEKAKISSSTQIGPFSHLRPDSIIGKNCKIGNFVETKKVELRDGVKASHLTYLGDAFIDEGTNVGAGTITCNYDGVKKHKTIIGKNVFIGSDTQLVAPIKIGDYTLIAAGTTVTKDTKENSLIHSRVKQHEIKNKGMKDKLCKK